MPAIRQEPDIGTISPFPMMFPMCRKTGDGCLPASSSPRKDVRPLNDNLRPDDAVLRIDTASILPVIWHPMYGGLLART